MRSLLLSTLFFMCTIVPLTESSKILMVPYSAEGSHYLSMVHIGEVLVDHGHSVSFLVSDVFTSHASDQHAFSYEFAPHHLGMDGWYERKRYQDEGMLGGQVIYRVLTEFGDLLRNFSMDCEDLVRNPSLRDRLVEVKYDFVLADAITPCGVMIAQMLRLPHGLFLPISAVPTLTRFISAPGDPSYIPAWQSGLSHRMSFLERSRSALMDIGLSIFFNVCLYTVHEELRIKYDIRTDVTSRGGMADAHFFLSFADWTLEYPRAHTPNMIGSAGLNLDATKGTLTEDWAGFMDTKGADGVIVLSFGTIVRFLPQSVTRKFVDALSKVPYTVLWHMPDETWTNGTLPANIKRYKWLPLPGLLAHNNTVLFISHTGINSMYEAFYYSKLILSFPIFGDQPDSARRLVDRGVSLNLDLYKSTSGEIVDAIMRLTTEKSFQRNLERVTSLYKEKPVRAREILPYVIEQAVRSKSLYLQRCRGQNMGFVQYYLIDVITFLVVLVGIISVPILRFLTGIPRYLWGQHTKLEIHIPSQILPDTKI